MSLCSSAWHVYRTLTLLILGAFSYLTDNGGSDPNSAIGNQGAQLLITNITDTRNQLKALNLATTLPVGTSDAGAYFNNLVLEAVDYGVGVGCLLFASQSMTCSGQMSNVHPWFANVSINDAASWTYEFFQEQNVQPAAALSNKPTMYIAETGWPSVRAISASNEF